MVHVSEEKDHYLSDFEAFKTNKEPAWAGQIRKAAMDCFAELGFPTTRDEAWRFTNVAPILKIPFRLVFGQAPLAENHVERFAFQNLRGTRLVFVDGLYRADLSSASKRDDGVKVESLAQALTTDSDVVRQHLAQHAEYKTDAFTALNTAFVRDGAFVYVPSGKVVEEPIHLLFVTTGREVPTVSYPRNLIVLGRGGMAGVIESYVASANGPCFTNAVTEVVVGTGAVLEHYRDQREGENAFQVATTQVYQDRDSVYSSLALAIGAELSRHNLNVLLAAEGAECALNGLYFVTGRQHVDTHTFIDHAKPHGTSNEFYKGILDGNSKGVFNGKILVRKDAQQTDAHQTNRNLVLSDDARVNTNPQLEILADDVKCTHGATIGQADEESIFYLKSRGISQQTALGLLTHGFASDVINRIKVEPVRDQFDALVWRKLQPRP